MPPSYFADRASRGNAVCRYCREKIKKNELRLGWFVESQEFGEFKQFFHVECFQPKNSQVTMRDFELLPSLESGDEEIVEAAIKGDLRKHNLEVLAGEDADDRPEPEKKKKKSTRTTTTKETRSEADGERRRSPRLAKIAARTTTTTRTPTSKKSKPSPNEEEEEEEKGPPLRSATKTKSREYFIAAPPGSSHPLVKLTCKNPVVAKYEDMTTEELKNVLRRNGQILRGRKEDLVAKCVDGEINGRIPGCPLCRQGQVFFVPEKGVYECRGHYDTDNFVFVRCTFHEPQIVRERWRGEGEAAVPKNHISPESFTGVFAKYASDENGTSSSSSSSTSSTTTANHHQQQHISIPTTNPSTVPPTGTAHPDNESIAQLFEDLAAYTRKLKPEHYVWKVRAFNHAARQIRTVPFAIKDGKSLAQGEHKVEGIGKGTAEIIDDFLKHHKTTSTELEQLKKEYYGSTSAGEGEEEEDFEDYE